MVCLAGVLYFLFSYISSNKGSLIFFRLTLCPSLELYLLLKKNLWNPRNSSARMLRVSSKFQIVTNKTEITLTLTALTSLFLLRFFYSSLFPSLFRVKCESVFCLNWEAAATHTFLSTTDKTRCRAATGLLRNINQAQKKCGSHPLTKDKDQVLKKI